MAMAFLVIITFDLRAFCRSRGLLRGRLRLLSLARFYLPLSLDFPHDFNLKLKS
jgi:hypothetical protein